ncbi:hypothetical protein JCM16303_006989 [Sporobolomyces ruberrimus]
MNYDHSWPPGPAHYPPLPPPTHDETAFLEEIAALSEEWPQIVNERSLRAEAIENRIATARLEASLPHFESFALGTSTSSSVYPSTSTPLANPSYRTEPQPYRPSFLPSQAPPPPPLFDQRSHLPSGYPQSSFVQQILSSQQQQQGDQAPLLESTRGGVSYKDARNRYPGSVGNVSQWGLGSGSTTTTALPPPAPPAQQPATNWWEQPIPQTPRYDNFDPSQGSLNTSGVPQPMYSQPPFSSQSSYTTHLQPQAQYLPQEQQQTAYRPVPPRPQQPTFASQLPYQQPSQEWNQALPPSYAQWEQQSSLKQQALPSRHYHEASGSSTESANLVPAGLTYATSATTQSTDRSRQSTSTLFSDFGLANEQLLATSLSNTSSAGLGKRTRFESANYERPPLTTQPHMTGTPSSSSQQTSSSSSSLPTAASIDDQNPSESPAPVVSASSSGPAVVTGNRRGTKTKIDVPIHCVSCGSRIARLILRGQKYELDVPYEAIFHCLNCASPAPDGGTEDSPSNTGTNQSERSLSNSPHAEMTRRTSTTSTSTSTPTIPSTFRKKNKRLDAGQSIMTACDVCLMDRATGSVLPREPEKGHTINFQIEVVCVSCDDKYQRCSDCGGGGGVRLGTGKWRSKELFKDGKKTCSLKHQRLGAFPEMEYQVWRNTELPKDEVEEITDKCGELFTNQMLGAIAIPEVLERQAAIWTSYAEAKAHAAIGWMGMGPMIRYDIEPSQGIRRYLALRLCAPNLRKTNRKAEVPAPSEIPRLGQVLKGDKEIVGYIIAEWDMKRGVLFLALVIPWDATGEAYDATTLLLQALCTRVQRDQRLENQARQARGEPLLPKVERVFTMLFFKTGSRMITQLTKKRGFAPLEEYLAANPRADPLAASPLSSFPPHRPIYLGVERQRGWIVLVRTLRENADGSVDDWSARRSADEERGKRKEARARLTREKREKEKDSSETAKGTQVGE